jgi:hypothetical protein
MVVTWSVHPLKVAEIDPLAGLPAPWLVTVPLIDEWVQMTEPTGP